MARNKEAHYQLPTQPAQAPRLARPGQATFEEKEKGWSPLCDVKSGERVGQAELGQAEDLLFSLFLLFQSTLATSFRRWHSEGERLSIAVITEEQLNRDPKSLEACQKAIKPKAAMHCKLKLKPSPT